MGSCWREDDLQSKNANFGFYSHENDLTTAFGVMQIYTGPINVLYISHDLVYAFTNTFIKGGLLSLVTGPQPQQGWEPGCRVGWDN